MSRGCSDDAGFDVVAQCDNADDLLSGASSPPDVVILDIRLPPTHSDEGLRAALELRSSHPEVGVLVLSQYVEVGLALKLLADSAEGVGYLLKDRIGDVDDFVASVRRVADGGSALDPIIVSTLLARQRPDDPIAALTPREREVLELMASGSSNQGIADSLVITCAPSRSTSRASSASWACRRRAASRAGAGRPDVSALVSGHQKPAPDSQVSRLLAPSPSCKRGAT